MKTKLFLLIAATILLSGCGSIKKKTSNDADGYAITRTYLWGIPVYEERAWVDTPMPTGGADTMKWMDRQMQKTDESVRIHLNPGQ
ncbi:MAG: hypothetical protein ABFD69_13295 [Candidatus Sumerlaeia bacterium]